MIVKIARAAAWLLVLAAAVLTLGPPTVRPHTAINHGLEHFAAFALVGFAFGLGYPNRRWMLALFGIALTAAMEILQQWVPGRHANLSDFAINSLGAWAGLAASAMVDWLRHR